MKYVYCLARHEPSPPDAFPPGLGGAKVHHISFSGISALISHVDSVEVRHAVPVPDTVQNVLAHQEVVDAALRLYRSVIPCRFGTLFPDNKNILMFLKEHYTRLDAHLTKLEGKIEVSVQVILNRRGSVPVPALTAAPLATREQGDAETRGQSPQRPSAASPCLKRRAGISYLLKKKEKLHASKELDEQAERLSLDLNRAMSPLWSDVKIQKRSTERKLLLSICYLVDQQKLPAFKLAYQKFKRENPTLRLLYTGPWPPYTFADIDLRK